MFGWAECEVVAEKIAEAIREHGWDSRFGVRMFPGEDDQDGFVMLVYMRYLRPSGFYIGDYVVTPEFAGKVTS